MDSVRHQLFCHQGYAHTNKRSDVQMAAEGATTTALMTAQSQRSFSVFCMQR